LSATGQWDVANKLLVPQRYPMSGPVMKPGPRTGRNSGPASREILARLGVKYTITEAAHHARSASYTVALL